MKIHITLVGGQPAPVYHGIVATTPDYVIFICSNSSRPVLDKLIPELSVPSRVINLDPTNPYEIKALADTLAKTFEKDEVTVNISSGLKSWSHFFGLAFDRCPNAAVVYMDQNNVLWNYRTMSSSVDFEFDMHALFRIYGNALEHYKRLSYYTEADQKCIPRIEEARRFSHEDFKNLTSVLDKNKMQQLKRREGYFDARSGSYVEWKRDSDKCMETVHLCLYGRSDHWEEFTFQSPHAIDVVFNTAWFELKVASILSRWPKAHEVLMNCRFPYVSNIDKNEVDVMVNTGMKILFVECKTHIYNSTDIDKFSSVVRAYGGTGSKGIFITMDNMDNMAIQKCMQHGLLYFSLANNHGNKSSEEALFSLLDKEIMHINTK